MKKQRVLPRHKFYFKFFRFVGFFASKLYHVKYEKFKIKKNEKYLFALWRACEWQINMG